MERENFKPFEPWNYFEPGEMLSKSIHYFEWMQKRRTIREFSNRKIPKGIIENCLKAAGTAPSGANKQPWLFVAVESEEIKKKIRLAAEREETEFYNHRAPTQWLQDLKPFETNASKPYLDIAPYLIAIFYQTHTMNSQGEKLRTYYPKESTGIATGILITALHNCGLATLTHTPSPMSFLNQCLDVPQSQYCPFLLLVTGYPKTGTQVPILEKKPSQKFIKFL